MQTPEDVAINIKYVSSGAKRARQTGSNTLLVYRDPTSAPYTEAGDGIDIVTDPVTGIATVSSTGVLGIAHTNHGISGPSQAGDLTLVAGDGISITSPQDGEILVSQSSTTVNTIDAMFGDIVLSAGTGIAINSADGVVSITNTGVPNGTPGVESIAGHAGAPLTGNVLLDQGNGILVTQADQVITTAIDASVVEALSNKTTNFTNPDNIKYPTSLAVSTGLAGKLSLQTSPPNTYQQVYSPIRLKDTLGIFNADFNNVGLFLAGPISGIGNLTIAVANTAGTHTLTIPVLTGNGNLVVSNPSTSTQTISGTLELTSNLYSQLTLGVGLNTNNRALFEAPTGTFGTTIRTLGQSDSRRNVSIPALTDSTGYFAIGQTSSITVTLAGTGVSTVTTWNVYTERISSSAYRRTMKLSSPLNVAIPTYAGSDSRTATISGTFAITGNWGLSATGINVTAPGTITATGNPDIQPYRVNLRSPSTDVIEMSFNVEHDTLFTAGALYPNLVFTIY